MFIFLCVFKNKKAEKRFLTTRNFLPAFSFFTNQRKRKYTFFYYTKEQGEMQVKM